MHNSSENNRFFKKLKFGLNNIEDEVRTLKQVAENVFAHLAKPSEADLKRFQLFEMNIRNTYVRIFNNFHVCLNFFLFDRLRLVPYTTQCDLNH